MYWLRREVSETKIHNYVQYVYIIVIVMKFYMMYVERKCFYVFSMTIMNRDHRISTRDILHTPFIIFRIGARCSIPFTIVET